MKTTILLDESSHTYTVNGTVKPSVTKVLETLIYVERFDVYVDALTGNTIAGDIIREAGDFGKAVHKAAALVMQGKNIKFDDALKHPISELMGWMSDYNVSPEMVEMLCYSHKLDVCGTLDWIGHINSNDVLNLVDYKTALHAPMVGPQTWAYEQCYRAMTGYKGIIKRWVLYLPKKEGEYKFIELKDPTDEHEFRSLNYHYNWMRRV